MILGQLIGIGLIVLAVVILAVTLLRNRSVKSVRRLKRKAVISGQLPKTNGQGSRYGNRRVFRGRTRRMRPAPPNRNGHGGSGN